MKKIGKILKIIAISIVGLILLVAIILVGFYQINYKPTPKPSEVNVSAFKKSNINADQIILMPIPQKLQWGNDIFHLKEQIIFTSSKEDELAIKNFIKNRFNKESKNQVSGEFKFLKNIHLNKQAYNLTINSNIISVEYSDLQGLFYALTTIKQIAKQSNNQLPSVTIEDQPDLKTRGAFLDISRGKVPKIETLYEMIDFLSDLKYNHVELYVEGFSFGYPSFKNLWEKSETPITPDEVKLLDNYCKDRFIDLVPNQNSLGHMDAWLATDQYKDLAECPEGYNFLGLIKMKSTIAPLNPKSIDLVKKMSDDLLPNFSSNKYNVNLDEPFELGKSKDHPIKDPKEIAKVYIEYAKKLNDYTNSKGKNMFMWGDIISRNPEIIKDIPKNITLLEWRYESFQDFENICKTYQQSGLHYMVCPGTSTWTDFTGRTENMLANVENSVLNGVKYGADGMIITDWGDKPHLQYLTLSYPGLTYGAALSWNSNSKPKSLLGAYLSKQVFNDKSNNVGDIILDLGRYNQYEEYPMVGGTTTGWAYRFGFMNKMMMDAIFKKFQNAIFELLPQDGNTKEFLKQRYDNPQIYDAEAIIKFVENREQAIIQTYIGRKDSSIIIDEYLNSIRMVKLGAMLKKYNNYHLQMTDDENKVLLTSMKNLCGKIIPEHKRLWEIRNKNGGLENSTESMKAIQTSVDENLALLNKNFMMRWANRTFDKIKTSAAILYLK